jgi:hypothetical protein
MSRRKSAGFAGMTTCGGATAAVSRARHVGRGGGFHCHRTLVVP